MNTLALRAFFVGILIVESIKILIKQFPPEKIRFIWKEIWRI